MTPIRVLVLIDQFFSPDGGTEQQLHGLLARLDRDRVAPDLVVLRRLTDYVDSGDLPAPTTCLELGPVATAGYWRAMGGLVRRLRSGRWQMLHTFFPESVTLGPYLAAASGVPLLTSRRDLGFWYTPARLFWLRAGRRFTWRWLANSEAVRESVCAREGAPAGRVEVIPNAMDADRLDGVSPGDVRAELGLTDDEPVLVLPANLRPVKGVDVAVAALGELVRRGGRAHLVSIGENSQLLPAYRELCVREGVADRVTFLGHLPRAETLRWVAGADVVLNTSHSEGSSNAVLEAMALGRCVVATAVGGNREAVADGETGRLVPAGDAAALAAALADVLADRARLAAMGARGRARVRGRHDPAAVVHRYEEIYRAAARGVHA